MKKIVVMLFLVLTVSVATGQGKSYARGVIRKGDILIYNKTPLDNKDLLKVFRRYWSNQPSQKRRAVEKLFYFVIKANFSQAKYCELTFENLRYFKPSNATIKLGSNGVYYAIIGNYRVSLGKSYRGAKKYLSGKKSRVFHIGFYILTVNGKWIRSCNNELVRNKKEATDKFLMPLLAKAGY